MHINNTTLKPGVNLPPIEWDLYDNSHLSPSLIQVSVISMEAWHFVVNQQVNHVQVQHA